MNYRDKVVLVTGGANGIGKAITLAYCQAGATVIFCDCDDQAGMNLASDLQLQQLKGCYYKIDLADVQAIATMFTDILHTYSAIDILINNAGKVIHKSIFEVTVQDWDDIINVNLRAAFFCSKEFAKQLPNSRCGRIINIASTRYLMSESNTEAYAASKGGLFSLTHALAMTLQTHHILVNSISPGWIETKNYDALREEDHLQHPSRRVGRPEDIARACLFLTDENNDFVNGENLVIDGGMTRKMIYEA